MKSRLLLLCLFGLASARTQHERQDEETSCTTPEMAQPNQACKGLFRKWAFNDVFGHCERFAFGGCHPGSLTNNLYDSKYECMAKCEKSKMLRGKPGPPTDLCYLPPVKGMISCMAFMPRWTFDVSATEGPRCIRYIYGGCAGTANLFTSETDCLAACGDAITNIAKKCPLRELVSSCDQYCSGDRDCDNGQVCCPSSGNECGPQCVPPITSFTLTENSSDSTITAQERSTLTLQKRSICQQPIRKGLCSASMRKFAFKPEKNRCEVFTYGGCQGNENNFVSASDCQKTCGGDVPNIDPACESVQCDVTSIRPYQDRQCLPEYADGACCPTSYSCDAETAEEPLSEPKNHVCLYKGQGYEAGPIPAITLDDPCYNCSCMPPTKPYTTKASVICTLQTCPPLGNPPSTDCIIVKVPGQCCNEWKCDLARPLSTCTANNQTEFEGGVFYPTPCRKCICTANYTDENGYGCSDEVCFHQLPSACVPVYEDGVCCPVDFHCPTGEEHTATPPVRAVTLPFKIDRSTLRHQPFNQSHCLLPHDVGRCKASSFRFHYDAATQKCLGFYYGGCHGNKNRFSTEAECEQACAGVTLENASAPTDIIASRILPHKPAEDVCQHPKDPGPCRGFVPLYYYDGATGACQRFMYGGCKGNGNRFLSQQDCETRCTNNSDPSAQNFSICSLPLAKGPCRAKKQRFFFNATSQQCEPFSYGGCVGNDNNFITLALCETECKPKTDSAIEARMAPVDPSKVEEDGATAGVSVTSEPSPILPDLAPEASVSPPSIPEFCSLPSDIGPCRAHKPRYFHNPATGHCEKFHFGGCRGNKNNFHTQKECETACQIGAQGSGPETVQPRNKLLPNLGREQCKLPMDPGPCRMAAPRYFHDSQTGKCEPFNYGGCEGNANNYLTAEECQVRCGKGISRKEYDEIMGHHGHGKHKKSNAKTHCSLPADPGFCLAYMPRFHYDSVTNECKLFIYGGCKGNANNFRTQQECLEHCGPESNATATLSTNSVCRFGNLTLNKGEKLSKNGTCFDCVCITPPDLTCTKMACAPVPRKATLPQVDPVELPQVDPVELPQVDPVELPQVDPVESTDEENADSKEKDEVKEKGKTKEKDESKDNSSDETSSEDKED